MYSQLVSYPGAQIARLEYCCSDSVTGPGHDSAVFEYRRGPHSCALGAVDAGISAMRTDRELVDSAASRACRNSEEPQDVKVIPSSASAGYWPARMPMACAVPSLPSVGQAGGLIGRVVS
jgi:hypothetical protein